MNLREVQLSSRSVIPVALALPINREPADTQAQTEWIQRQRDAANNKPDPEAGVVSFYL
jgi:hypothetical protein